MWIKIVTLILILGICSSYAQTPQNKTWVEKLKQDLLKDYDKLVRPAEQSSATKLEIGLTALNVRLYEDKSQMGTSGWLFMQWEDENLKWDPKDYNGISVVHILSSELWQPDIEVYNGIHGMSKFGVTNCIVYNVGRVLFVPPFDIRTFCNLDLKLWPFDTQVCTIVFGSWTYSELALNLTASANNTTILPITKSHSWEINKIGIDRHVKYYPCCAEPYVDVQFNLTITRESTMFKEVVSTSVIVIILLILTTFWISSHYAEKIILNGVNAIVITLFLLYFSHKLPSIETNTPIIVTFFTSSLIVVSLSIILSVIITNMNRSKHSRRIPSFLRGILKSCLVPVLCINSGSDLNDNSELREADDIKPSAIQKEWNDLATAIDRVAFIVFACGYAIIIVSNMQYFSNF